MTDDRDRRRYSDALHPAISEPGEFDTDDDRTPVGGLSRRRVPVVDPHEFEPQLANIEWGRGIEARLAAAEERSVKAEARAGEALAKWKWPQRILVGLSGFSLTAIVWVLTEVRSSGYEARRSEEQRGTIDVLKVEVRALREDLIRIGERLRQWRPVGSVPVIGPHNKDD